MKHHSSATKAPPRNIGASPSTSNPGKDASALAPPRYGIEFVDRAASAQAEETRPRNHTGLPDGLKSGIESLSGISLDHVKVHYQSSRPAQLNALAYTQGADIHVAPGQEHHLPHEAWHVVQQAQGRVTPTMQLRGGIEVNDDEELEHEADVMGRKGLQQKPSQSGVVQAPLSLRAALPLQAMWIPKPVPRGEPPIYVDETTGDEFVAVRRFSGTVEVRRLVEGQPAGPLFNLRLYGEVGVDIEPGDEEDEGGSDSQPHDTDLPHADTVDTYDERRPTAAEQADDQLRDRRFRLARLETGFTTQVEVAPIASGKQGASEFSYTADEVVATLVMVGNRDRPETYLEPKKGSGSIPQGKHTVAWSFMRRSLASLAGLRVREILLRLAYHLGELDPFVQSPEGRFLLRNLEIPDVGQPADVIRWFVDQRRPLAAWQRLVTDVVRVYAQIHHLSVNATVAGLSKQRGEARGLATLRACEASLAQGHDPGLVTADIPEAAEALLEVQQRMDPRAFAAAVFRWVVALGEVFPHVMQHFGSGVISGVLARPLARTFLAHIEAPAGATVLDLLQHHGHAIPWPFAPPMPRLAVRPHRLIDPAPYEDMLGDFVANIDIVPISGAPYLGVADLGMASAPITARLHNCLTLQVRRVLVSDLDRPATQFGSAQQSHTVAWTLLRAEIASFANRPLVDLLLFLHDEFRELEQPDTRHDMRQLAQFALAQLDARLNPTHLAPAHFWQSDVSRLVVWYFHVHQSAGATTYFDPRTAQASGHGEASHMDVLRRTERQLYEWSRPDASPERVVRAAVALCDVWEGMGQVHIQLAVQRWSRALLRTFPHVMRALGDQILEALARTVGGHWS